MRTKVRVVGLPPGVLNVDSFPETATLSAIVTAFQKKEPKLRGLFYQGRLQPATAPLRNFLDVQRECTFDAYLPSDGPGLEKRREWTVDELQEAALGLDERTVEHIPPDKLQRVQQFAPDGIAGDPVLIAIWYMKSREDIAAMESYVRSIASRLH
jgi:hypothetical protein